jgi:hypothetical protein
MEAYRAFFIKRGKKHTHILMHSKYKTFVFFFPLFGVTMNTYCFLQLEKKLNKNQKEMNEKKKQNTPLK